MTERDWLGSRLAETPGPLRERLEEEVAGVDRERELAPQLLAAATRHLESVQSRLRDREAAFELLVADGLLTLACEAAARDAPERVGEICRSMGPGGELGRLAGRWLEGS